MDDCRSPITGDSWGISDEWGRFCQLSLVPPAPSTKSPRWSDWHWGNDGRIVRYNLDDREAVEECGDRCYLEQDLESLKEIRQEYLDLALKSKSKSRAKEMMRGVRGKDRQIAWVEGKLRELGSDCDQSGGDHHLSSTKLLEDKSEPTEISSSKMADPQKLLEDKNRDRQISSSKTRRHKGNGSGCIYWRTLTKNGKDYQQAYYQYEFWEKGNRLIKSCKYIPKSKLAQVQMLNDEKAPVREILKLLGVVKA
jgi:hypothetical protein